MLICRQVSIINSTYILYLPYTCSHILLSLACPCFQTLTHRHLLLPYPSHSLVGCCIPLRRTIGGNVREWESEAFLSPFCLLASDSHPLLPPPIDLVLQHCICLLPLFCHCLRVLLRCCLAVAHRCHHGTLRHLAVFHRCRCQTPPPTDAVEHHLHLIVASSSLPLSPCYCLVVIHCRCY